MVAKIAQDGKIALPEQVREQADLNPGDTLNIQVYKGTIVLRKNQALSPEECAALLEQSRLRPAPTDEDDLAVEEAIKEVRTRRQ